MNPMPYFPATPYTRFLLLPLLLITFAVSVARAEPSPASSVIGILDREKPVHIKGRTLTGDLDFT
ncbi:MAG: hypothetical protein AAF514_24175, partial [Verrucomicrobiota bacterium]